MRNQNRQNRQNRHRGSRATSAAPRGALLVGIIASLVPALASARCPDEKLDETLCEPRIAFLQPTVIGTGYFPRHAAGPMLGGGLEIVWLEWTSNTTSSGPGSGKLHTSVVELGGLRDSEHAVMWLTGALVSIEKNPSRHFLIPYFGPSFGGVLPSFGDNRVFVDATAGLYLYHSTAVSLDARGSYMFALSSNDNLSGARAELAASLSLW